MSRERTLNINSEVLSAYVKSSGLSQEQFAKSIGTNRQTLSNWIKGGYLSMKYYSILKAEMPEDLFRKLILTKEMFMELISENVEAIVVEDSSIFKEPEVEYDNSKGIPFYDIDFVASFDVVQNSQSASPDTYVLDPLFYGSEYIVRCMGDSMEPKIPHGSYIGIKRANLDNLINSQIYAIVTDDWRTVKYAEYSDNEGFLTMYPENKESCKPQEVKIQYIRSIWLVIAYGLKIN